MTVYTVRLPVYEGPLDLLLELIERAELDITKIALAQVTDQYLAHLRSVAERDLADLASFLVVATRLLQIKSEALLPRPPEREPGEEDPRRDGDEGRAEEVRDEDDPVRSRPSGERVHADAFRADLQEEGHGQSEQDPARA